MNVFPSLTLLTWVLFILVLVVDIETDEIVKKKDIKIGAEYHFFSRKIYSFSFSTKQINSSSIKDTFFSDFIQFIKILKIQVARSVWIEFPVYLLHIQSSEIYIQGVTMILVVAVLFLLLVVIYKWEIMPLLDQPCLFISHFHSLHEISHCYSELRFC